MNATEASELVQLAADPPAGKLLVVITPALTGSAAKTKWVKSLAEAGVWLALRPPDVDELPGWMAQRLKAAGLTFDREALEMLAARVEGNLLAARQDLVGSRNHRDLLGEIERGLLELGGLERLWN